MKAIRFTASWCGPCKIYKPIWEKVSEELKDTGIDFKTVDIDSDISGLAAQYRVKSIPTTVIVSPEGTIIKTGLVQEDKLKELLDFND
mgnify:CR=1 FL=1